MKIRSGWDHGLGSDIYLVVHVSGREQAHKIWILTVTELMEQIVQGEILGMELIRDSIMLMPDEEEEHMIRSHHHIDE